MELPMSMWIRYCCKQIHHTNHKAQIRVESSTLTLAWAGIKRLGACSSCFIRHLISTKDINRETLLLTAGIISLPMTPHGCTALLKCWTWKCFCQATHPIVLGPSIGELNIQFSFTQHRIPLSISSMCWLIFVCRFSASSCSEQLDHLRWQWWHRYVL